MSTSKTRRASTLLVVLVVLFSQIITTAGAAPKALTSPVTFTILHTNDFHGQLEPSGSNPGAARVAQKIADVRAAVGDQNVLALDAGDMMQGSLLSNLQKGLPTIDYYRTAGFDAATFGNHEFDWGQTVLGERIAQAESPATADETPMQMVVANITTKAADGSCTWGPFNPAVTPYELFTVGAAPNTATVAVIGVGSVETPYITIAEATAGLCFRDPAESIQHYYAAMDAESDFIVVLSHNGFTDGGYGYGFTVYGDQTLASKLNTAGTPVDLIIGGHSHTNLSTATKVGNTTVVQAYYNGRRVGRADVTIDGTTKTLSWASLVVSTSDPQYPPVLDMVSGYVSDPAYQALINQPIGYTQVDLLRNYNGDNMMGDFVDDAIYGALNEDADPANDVDMFFNNAGGIRIDWCDKEDPVDSGNWVWTSTATDCQTDGLWTHDPMLLTYGQMFQILPFGNATAVGSMTGAQIYELLNQSATLFKGALQPSGIRYKFFRYSDALPGPQPYGWGAYDVEVYNHSTHKWEPLDASKTYKVGTNEFLAPAGQDGFTPFKYMTGITYWGDMLNAVNAFVSAHYTADNPYLGPDGDGTLDGRITRNGDGDDTYEAGEIVPLTILHHNDSHGNLDKTGYVGYTQLATLIKQERLHNPDRTLLLSSGDNIQGDAMSYYFKTAPTGFASDGTAITDPTMHIQPLIKAFNAMGYDAMTLGNHEFNFGKDVFTSVLSQATFPVLQANVTEDPANPYGLAAANVQPYVEKTLGDIDVAILGIGNHRIPNYELPSNIPGLTFTDPIAKTQELSDLLGSSNDVVIALTHIGFTENPSSVEVDANVDTNLVANTTGIDALVGGHSHTDPAYGFGAYKYLPTIVADANGDPVAVTQAYRYNNTLGEVSLGLRPLGSGDYEVVSQTGRYIKVATGDAEDPDIDAIVTPYTNMLTAYNNTVLGQTTVPIDALKAFTQETNAANLQADASVYELETKNGIDVDFHLSGAMTNRAVATAGPYPVTLKVSDMFTLMPYENSLVVMEMNGPQLKAVLERAYRNYYYYKYVPGYGGYSYYTTCMLDINAVGKITYNDLYPAAYDPAKQYVVSLEVNGIGEIDFADADTYYRVSTVNYLAAGSCNFNNSGVSLWPLSQIVNDTQYYVRDAVIDYIKAQTAPISPAIEGRLNFITDTTAPVITINAPEAKTYLNGDSITLDFFATDDIAGVKSVTAMLDGAPVTNGQVVELYGYLPDSTHTLVVTATDKAYNTSSASVTFTVETSIQSMMSVVTSLYEDGSISSADVYHGLMDKLQAAAKAKKVNTAINILNAFLQQVNAQKGKSITSEAADLLIADIQWLIARLQ